MILRRKIVLAGGLIVVAAAWAGCDTVVREELPFPKPSQQRLAQMPEKVLAQGRLKDADSSHRGSGGVTIYRLSKDTHLVRLEDIKVTYGPGLHVLLASHPAPAGPADLKGGYLDLGALKGNIGSQNYPIPAGTDVSIFKSVVIYCIPFHVVFATATLE